MTSDLHPDASSSKPAVPSGHCTQCGASAEPTWDYCGACGGALDHPTPVTAPDLSEARTQLTEPIPVITDLEPHKGISDLSFYDTQAPTSPGSGVTAPKDQARRASHWSRPQIIVIALLAVALLILAGGAGYWQKRTSDDLEATRQALSQTETDLASTSKSLAQTTRRLNSKQMQLDAKTSELADVQTQLGQAQRQLSGVQGSLNKAQDRLDLQANQIETLKSCLNGVSSSLSYAAQNDYTSALAALDAVQVSCQRAQTIL